MYTFKGRQAVLVRHGTHWQEASTLEPLHLGPGDKPQDPSKTTQSRSYKLAHTDTGHQNVRLVVTKPRLFLFFLCGNNTACILVS